MMPFNTLSEGTLHTLRHHGVSSKMNYHGNRDLCLREVGMLSVFTGGVLSASAVTSRACRSGPAWVRDFILVISVNVKSISKFLLHNLTNSNPKIGPPCTVLAKNPGADCVWHVGYSRCLKNHLGCSDPEPVWVKGHQINGLVCAQILDCQLSFHIVVRRICGQIHP